MLGSSFGNSVLPTIIYGSNIVFILMIIFVERKKPINAVAWIITLLFLPFVGYVFYILFGNRTRFHVNKVFRVKTAYDRTYKKLLLEQCDLLKTGKLPIKNKSALLADGLLRYNTIGAESIYTEDNQVEIFTSAKDKYTSLLHDIRKAKKSIHLLYFIYRNDGIGRHILEALTQKAKEGVKVRCLIDDVGSITTPKSHIFKDLIAAGGELARFNPLISLTRVNYRNHRKLVIIDGHIGYLGGMNIGDEYMGLKRIKHWRDTHMRITGHSVYLIQMRFLMDWRYAKKEMLEGDQNLFPPIPPEETGKVGLQIISSGPDSTGEHIKNAYMRMIHDTKKELYIQTPYFIPDEPFLDALKMLLDSGVQLHLMIPGQYDKFIVYQTSFSYIGELLNYENAHIYLYDGFIHAKMLVMDDVAVSIGTTNIDIRSFFWHFEINAFIFDRNVARQSIRIFKKDAEQSVLLTKEGYQHRALYRKILEPCARLFSPLL